MDTMIDLSIAAHARAAKYGVTVPAAREDLRSYAMKWFHGTPVFDEARMRDDQSDDLMAVLRRLAGRQKARNVKEMLQDYMEAYGGPGLRVQDIAEALRITRPGVLKHMKALVESGKVDVREERNPRGHGASPRKRYYWAQRTDTSASTPWSDETKEDIYMMGDGVKTLMDVGIIHHGTSTGALQGCRCGRCRWALEEGYFGEMMSVARQAGGSGFAEGVELTTMRRKAQEYVEARRNG